MRILGLDPGLRTTGYGVVEVTGNGVKVLEAGVIEPNPREVFERRLLKIHQHVGAILKTHTPQVAVLEKIYTHSLHPATAGILGHVRGVICLCAAQEKIELIEQSVKRVRQALLGNGNASKVQVAEFVKRLLRIKASRFKLDASDALCLALGQAHMMRYRLL